MAAAEPQPAPPGPGGGGGGIDLEGIATCVLDAAQQWQSVLTGEEDGSAELAERVTQVLRKLDLAEDVEYDKENPSDTEPELPPVPSQARKRKVFTREQRDGAATKDAEKP